MLLTVFLFSIAPANPPPATGWEAQANKIPVPIEQVIPDRCMMGLDKRSQSVDEVQFKEIQKCLKAKDTGSR